MTVGPRELTGAVDLISHYQLLTHHDYFCKRSLPLSIQDTHYLYDVVGDTEIRKGEGMQLDQLIQNPSNSRDTGARIQPFDLDALREAFQLRETSPVDLPPVRIQFQGLLFLPTFVVCFHFFFFFFSPLWVLCSCCLFFYLYNLLSHVIIDVHFCWLSYILPPFRPKREFLQLLGNRKASPKTRSGSTKSTKTGIRRKIESTRSTSTVIKIEVRIRTRRKRKTEVGIMTLVVISQRSTMKRLGKCYLCFRC